MISREWNWDEAKEALREEKAEEIAANLFKDGMSKEFVVRNTGLSAEQVEKIANEARTGEQWR